MTRCDFVEGLPGQAPVGLTEMEQDIRISRASRQRHLEFCGRIARPAQIQQRDTQRVQNLTAFEMGDRFRGPAQCQKSDA
jgi:hypothetical protein